VGGGGGGEFLNTEYSGCIFSAAKKKRGEKGPEAIISRNCASIRFAKRGKKEGGEERRSFPHRG